jgi:hypothetical protein
VWTWHHRIAVDGTWDRVLAKLTAAADAAGLVDWSLSVDSTVVRASARDEHDPHHRVLDRIRHLRHDRILTEIVLAKARKAADARLEA